MTLTGDAGEAPSITRLEQLQLLSSEEAARGLPVRVRGVVTYADQSWRLLYLQDETAGFPVTGVEGPEELHPGDEVELVAVTADGESGTRVLSRKIQVLGQRPLPKPLVLSEADLATKKPGGQWVEITGVARQVESLDERLKLEFVTGNTRLMCYVRRASGGSTNYEHLVGAKVRVQGVRASPADRSGMLGVGLFIPDMTNVVVVGPALPRHQYPMTPIQQALAGSQTGEAAPRLRIRGVVAGKQGASSLRAISMVVRDETGTITVVSSTRKSINVDDLVDIWAFPALTDRGIILEDADHEEVVDTGTAADGNLKPATSGSTNTLRTVKEVRALSKTEAARRIPVHLEGVVTYADPAWPHFFLQDHSGALFVRAWKAGLKAGQRVAVDGMTDPGGIARMVVDATLQVVGETNFPEPLQVDLKALLTETYDCSWVELEGVVRSVAEQQGHAILKLVSEQGRFEAVLPLAGELTALSGLVDTRVRLRGVCTGILNSRDQWVSIQLRVPDPTAIQTIEPAPADAFAADLRPIGAVNQEALSLLGLRRVRVRGEVTLAGPGPEFSLQDDTGAIRISSGQTNRVQVGEVLEVVGFPVLDGLANRLEEALFRRSRDPVRVVPRGVDAGSILPQGRHDRQLIVLEGQLLNDAGGSALPSLLIRSGTMMFSAWFETRSSNQKVPLWRAGSQLRLTGVCSVQPDERNEPRSFVLLLRSAGDVQVLRRPSWWTPEHAAAMGSGLAMVVLAALAWGFLLRRQVREKTAQIRRRIEREAALEKRLSLVWETSAEGMRLLDPRGLTVKVNDAYCRMVGKPRDELEGCEFVVVYQENRRAAILDSYRQRFDSGAIPPHVEEELVLWNGKTVWFAVTNALLEQSGFPTLVLSQFRNVTERKRAEEERHRLQTQLVQAQKMESVGRLAGGVAHDFNNMLQVILGNLDVGLSRVSQEDPLRTDMEEAYRAALRSADLTRQLLAFARKQTMVPRVLDLNETVASMLKMLQRLIGENIQLVWTPGPNLWPIRMDPAQLDQILANLTVNARDAITGVGKITIETGNLPLSADEIADQSDVTPGEYVLLAITDNGPGMGREVMDHLFEPFFTTKEVGKGTGLGLATVYGIVKQNHGLIRIQSELGHGTAVRIFLPRCPEEVRRVSDPAHLRLRRGNETVLLVEDEEQILKLGHRFLQHQGYTVLTARTPAEALERVRAHGAPIHLLITDVIMPGMNGSELWQATQSLHPNIQCLFMSGYTADVIGRQGVLDAGVQYLQKPFKAEELAEKIRALLDRRPAAPGVSRQ